MINITAVVADEEDALWGFKRIQEAVFASCHEVPSRGLGTIRVVPYVEAVRVARQVEGDYLAHVRNLREENARICQDHIASARQADMLQAGNYLLEKRVGRLLRANLRYAKIALFKENLEKYECVEPGAADPYLALEIAQAKIKGLEEALERRTEECARLQVSLDEATWYIRELED